MHARGGDKMHEQRVGVERITLGRDVHAACLRHSHPVVHRVSPAGRPSTTRDGPAVATETTAGAAAPGRGDRHLRVAPLFHRIGTTLSSRLPRMGRPCGHIASSTGIMVDRSRCRCLCCGRAGVVSSGWLAIPL